MHKTELSRPLSEHRSQTVVSQKLLHDLHLPKCLKLLSIEFAKFLAPLGSR